MEIIRDNALEVLGVLLKSLDGTDYKINYCGYEFMLNGDAEAYIHFRSNVGNHEIYIRRHSGTGLYRVVTPESISDNMEEFEIPCRIKSDIAKMCKNYDIERVDNSFADKYKEDTLCNHGTILPCGNNVALVSVDNMCIEFTVPSYVTVVSNYAFEDSIELKKVICDKSIETGIKSAVANTIYPQNIKVETTK